LQLSDTGLSKTYNIEIGRSATDGDLTFRSTGGEKVRFTEVGLVGILQASPISQLSIGAGSSSAVSDGTTTTSTLGLNLSITDDSAYAMGIRNFNASGDGLLIQAGDQSDDYALRIEDYDGANDLFVIRGDGNVGIGTSAPASPLNVYSNSAIQATFNGWDPIGGAQAYNGTIAIGNNAAYVLF